MAMTQKEMNSYLKDLERDTKDIEPSENDALSNLLSEGYHNVHIVGIEKVKSNQSKAEGLKLLFQSIKEPNKGSSLTVWHYGKDGNVNEQSIGIAFNQLKMAFDPESESQSNTNFATLVKELIENEEPVTIKVAKEANTSKDSKDARTYLNGSFALWDKDA